MSALGWFPSHMKLLIDIGNTRAKWALCCSSKGIQARGFLGQKSLFDADSAATTLLGQIQQVWISCVGKPECLARVCLMVDAELGLVANVVRVESYLAGLQNNYNDLNRLGVDRWVAAIAARSIAPFGALIVVDAGTAVTVDLISDCNVFEGGVILPGMLMMHDSLVGKTAGIVSEVGRSVSVVGKTTQECVNAGTHFGLLGGIERVVKEMLGVIGHDDVRLMLCGGDAKVVQSLSVLPFELHPDLVFNGLNVISNCKNKE